MKRLFILSIVFLLALAANAQGVSGGLRAGLNLSNASFDLGGISLEPDMQTGYLGGVYLTVMATDKIGFQGEAQVALSGYKLKDFDIGNGPEDYSQKNLYVNVPLLLRYNVTEFLNLHAGPQVGILMSSKATFGSVTEDVKSDFKSTDFTGVVGIGLDLPFGLNGGLRYNMGLSNVADDDTVDVKNKSFQVYVGYKLFGKK